jgi:hypothetical protein
MEQVMSLVNHPLQQLQAAAAKITQLTAGVENIPQAALRLRHQTDLHSQSPDRHKAMALALKQLDEAVHYNMQMFIDLYEEQEVGDGNG